MIIKSQAWSETWMLGLEKKNNDPSMQGKGEVKKTKNSETTGAFTRG